MSPLVTFVAAGYAFHHYAVAQQPDLPVVRAVLFMSPACSHCHYVITELLMGMAEEYGDRLEIVLIDVTQPGAASFITRRSTTTRFQKNDAVYQC